MLAPAAAVVAAAIILFFLFLLLSLQLIAFLPLFLIPKGNDGKKFFSPCLAFLYPFVGSGVTSYIHDFSNQLTQLNKQYIIVSVCLYYQHAIYQQQAVG